jgi:MFS family permease
MVGRRPTEATAMLIGVVGGLLFYFLEGGVAMAVGIFLANLGAFGFAPAFGSHRSELFPTEIRSTASAWTVNASILGGLTGFAAGRFVVDAWGVPTTMAVLGGVVVASTLLILILPETKGLHLTAEESGPPTGAIPA